MGEQGADIGPLAAAARAEGSVREALRLLDGDGVAFDADGAGDCFEGLPQVDWLGVHMLADKLTGRDNEAAYETFMRALERHLDARVQSAGAGRRGAVASCPLRERLGGDPRRRARNRGVQFRQARAGAGDL